MVSELRIYFYLEELNISRRFGTVYFSDLLGQNIFQDLRTYNTFRIFKPFFFFFFFFVHLGTYNIFGTSQDLENIPRSQDLKCFRVGAVKP